MEGNPIAIALNRATSFRIYVAAILPNLKYYNYMYISKEERHQGSEVYKYYMFNCSQLLLCYDFANFCRDDITQIENDQLEEIKERQRIEQELADEIRLSSCFVEFLNLHQLFESMFQDDENGRILRLIGDEAEELINE